jgi:hypothetical protein
VHPPKELNFRKIWSQTFCVRRTIFPEFRKDGLSQRLEITTRASEGAQGHFRLRCVVPLLNCRQFIEQAKHPFCRESSPLQISISQETSGRTRPVHIRGAGQCAGNSPSNRPQNRGVDHVHLNSRGFPVASQSSGPSISIWVSPVSPTVTRQTERLCPFPSIPILQTTKSCRFISR